VPPFPRTYATKTTREHASTDATPTIDTSELHDGWNTGGPAER